MRPYLRGGASRYEGCDLSLSASLAGAPGSVAPFVIRSGLDEVMGVAAADMEMINAENSVLRFAYEGQIGESTQIHSVSLRASAQF